MTTDRLNREPGGSVLCASSGSLLAVVFVLELTGCGSPQATVPPLAAASAAEAPAPPPRVAVKPAKPAERTAGSDARLPRDATFDDVKLDLKKDQPFKTEDLTAKVKELDGKWIKIRGYILPSFQDTGIKQFVLTRDNKECCFGPGAALHDSILVEMLDDATTNYTVYPVTVIGKFAIKEVADAEGKQLAIYRLDARETK
ncbi:MAG TPA: DUF3299 domain-containing protein [Pirellulales bacterium]|jgi:hypothetical protein